MNTRRGLVIALSAGAITPIASFAQAQKAPILIGWLSTGSRQESGSLLTTFKEGLSALGWKEGTQFVLEARWADGNYARLPSLAEELAAKKPAVIVTRPLQATVAAAKTAPSTPIVQAEGGDLVAAGLAASLARPGGMVTGLTNFSGDTSEKYLQLLLEVSPKLRRIGILGDPGNRNLPVLIDAVRRSLSKRIIEAQRIAKLAIAHQWPAISLYRLFAEAGLLLSYGNDREPAYRRAAFYVDRTLKGTKPGELPVEQPTTFEMAINLKTAKTLGIQVPQSILIQATKVIE